MTERGGAEKTMITTVLIVTGCVIGGLALSLGVAVLVGKAMSWAGSGPAAAAVPRGSGAQFPADHRAPVVLLGVVHPGLPSGLPGEEHGDR